MAERDPVKGAIEKAREARRRWLLFGKIEPGHRFQTRYHQRRRRRERGEASGHGGIFNLVGGFSLLVAGFLLSWIAVVAGLWLIAGEWLPLARLFDRLEVSMRELGRRLEGVWAGASDAERGLILLAILACVVALISAAYCLIFG